ncbi:Fc receptor-like protein 5 isoform X2 [Hoplias malabaricus]|uniref:Fc receptor-like protein 5 isoform X2 n=1 Tax=Hoplias malabaricus TaxID=27720 RepID=UPI0034630207
MELSALSVTLWLIVVIHNGETVKESDLPTPSLTVEPEGELFTGDSVTLKCEITTDGDWTYLWEKVGPGESPAGFQSVTEKRDTQSFAVPAVDGGQYRCRVQKTGGTRSSLYSTPVNLTVNEKPTVVLTINPKHAFRGETVTFRCDIKGGGDTQWTYRWIKDGQTLGRTEQQFSISSVTDSERGQYKCGGTGTRSSRYSETNAAVQLTVSEKPTVVLTINPKHAFRGETVTFRCDIKGGGDTQWTYRWIKDGQTLYLYRTARQFSISSVTESYRGQYKCGGTGTRSSRYSETNAAVQLTVSARPTPTLTRTPEGDVFTGESVALKCEIKDYDGWTYQWEKQNHGGWTVLSQSEYYTVNTDTLPIREGSTAVGNYRCRGERQGRPDSSNYSDVLKLTVNALPTPALTVEPEGDVFRGESVFLKCEIKGYSGWTYQWEKSKGRGWTTVSQSEYYTVNTGTITIREDYVSNRDQYRCRGQKTDRSLSSHYSEPVTLSVKEKPKPELTSSRKGPAVRGHPVVLFCELGQSAGWTFYWSKHTHNPENEISTETHSYTISSVSDSDEGQYWCRAGRGNPLYFTHYSDALWVNVTATSQGVSLVVSPSRTQHFTTDSLSLSCEGQRDSTGWRVRRHTHSEKVLDCSSVTGSTCNISSLSTSHTGVYWCESASGESSNPLNITVHNGAVILESPVRPLIEGDSLTLRCLYRDTKPSVLTADFYKDGSLLQNQTTAEMTIHTVSQSDEVLYHCKHSQKGESPKSWVSVRGASFSVLGVLSSVMAVIPYILVSIVLGVKCYRARVKPADEDEEVENNRTE